MANDSEKVGSAAARRVIWIDIDGDRCQILAESRVSRLRLRRGFRGESSMGGAMGAGLEGISHRAFVSRHRLVEVHTELTIDRWLKASRKVGTATSSGRLLGGYHNSRA